MSTVTSTTVVSAGPSTVPPETIVVTGRGAVPVVAGRRRVRARAALAETGRRWRADDGAATAEYAIVIMAAVGFAGLLVVIMRSDEVRGVLSDLVRSALTVG
jgi:hypothetical protein